MASVCSDDLEISDQKLSEIFRDGWKMYKDIENNSEPMNSEKLQDAIKKAIAKFELATRIVSRLSLFSLNEEFEEISTCNVKYLLLPCLLGNLNGKLNSKNRKENIDISEIYYKNFLMLCKSYNVHTFTNDNDEETTSSKPSLDELNRRRDIKIKRYKEKKEQEELINQMENEINTNKNEDEELQRNYHVTLLKYFINLTLDELENIKLEKTVLSQMDKTKSENHIEENSTKTRKPFKPFIITRNKLEKQIFGLGYPSVATMTVDEFYESRLKNAPGSIEDTTSLMAKAMLGVNQKDEIEADAIKAEIEEETEDMDALLKKRNWDDWKDDNRRGCGNRKNMG